MLFTPLSADVQCPLPCHRRHMGPAGHPLHARSVAKHLRCSSFRPSLASQRSATHSSDLLEGMAADAQQSGCLGSIQSGRAQRQQGQTAKPACGLRFFLRGFGVLAYLIWCHLLAPYMKLRCMPCTAATEARPVGSTSNYGPFPSPNPTRAENSPRC
jgi:hypothetical protein